MRLADPDDAPQRKELDALDVRLIGELVADGRASFAALSEQVGLSPAAVRTRVQGYLDDRTITVSARVDAGTAGTAVVELALITVDRPASQVAEALQELDEVVFAACVTGQWGLYAEVRCRDRRHLVEAYDRLRAIPGVAEIESLPVVEIHKQDWSGLAEELAAHRSSVARNPEPAAHPLDLVDQRIVGAFMADGRVTFAELSAVTGLSPAAARARAQRLLEERIVVVQTMVSQRVLGKGTFAGVLLTARGGAVALAERLVELPESTVVAVTSGRYQVVGELWCRDGLHLLAILDRIRSLDEVARAECSSYLDIVKEVYGDPTPLPSALPVRA